jgi:BMFP domain-containing protein YqiC
MSVETTGDIVRRILTPEQRTKLAQAGLIVIKRADLDTQLEAYNLVKEQNKALRAKVSQLEERLGGGVTP